MKLKLTAAVVIALTGAFAEKANAQNSNVTTNLTVDLDEIRNIAIGQASVTIPFTTTAHYASGNSATATGHLVLNSSHDYQVLVKANGPNLTDGSSNTIPISTISITPIAGGGTTPPVLNTISTLTETDQVLASSPNGTNTTTLNIQYTASGGAHYLSKPAGDYTVTIAYTIAPL